MVESWLKWGAISPKEDKTKEEQTLCNHKWETTEH